MIMQCIDKLISELGPTGLLILGLYGILYWPIRDAARSLKTINEELGQIILLIKEQIIKSDR